MGIAFRFQNGEIQVNRNRFLGYTKDENKRLVIVPKEAGIVKRIYREFLEGAALKLTAFLPLQANQNGGRKLSERYSKTRSILGTLFCRKLIQWISFLRNGLSMTASCRSIM